MIRSVVFVLEESGWVVYHGPMFLDFERAVAWTDETCADLNAQGRIAAACVWEKFTGEVLEQRHTAA